MKQVKTGWVKPRGAGWLETIRDKQIRKLIEPQKTRFRQGEAGAG